jgi:hypothetical protein
MDAISAETGIGALLVVQVLKAVLPYVKPAKNGYHEHLKSVHESIKGYQDRVTSLLEKMNDREAVMNSKIESDHTALKEVHMGVHDLIGTANAVYREMPKRKSDP